MEWLANNWIWIVAIAAIFAMHGFGHGGHGLGNRHRRSGHAHEPRRSGSDRAGDGPSGVSASSAGDDPHSWHAGHTPGAAGSPSSVPAVSPEAAHAGHEETTAADGHRRRRHAC